MIRIQPGKNSNRFHLPQMRTILINPQSKTGAAKWERFSFGRVRSSGDFAILPVRNCFAKSDARVSRLDFHETGVMGIGGIAPIIRLKARAGIYQIDKFASR